MFAIRPNVFVGETPNRSKKKTFWRAIVDQHPYTARANTKSEARGLIKRHLGVNRLPAGCPVDPYPNH